MFFFFFQFTVLEAYRPGVGNSIYSISDESLPSHSIAQQTALPEAGENKSNWKTEGTREGSGLLFNNNTLRTPPSCFSPPQGSTPNGPMSSCLIPMSITTLKIKLLVLEPGEGGDTTSKQPLKVLISRHTLILLSNSTGVAQHAPYGCRPSRPALFSLVLQPV